MSDETLLHDLQCNHVAITVGREDKESIYSRAISEIERLTAELAEAGDGDTWREACKRVEAELATEKQANATLNESYGKACFKLVAAGYQLDAEKKANKILLAITETMNTAWQHDPPESGDTKWVRMRWMGRAEPRIVEEPVE